MQRQGGRIEEEVYWLQRYLEGVNRWNFFLWLSVCNTKHIKTQTNLFGVGVNPWVRLFFQVVYFVTFLETITFEDLYFLPQVKLSSNHDVCLLYAQVYSVTTEDVVRAKDCNM